jgi:hypothetical protein
MRYHAKVVSNFGNDWAGMTYQANFWAFTNTYEGSANRALDYRDFGPTMGEMNYSIVIVVKGQEFGSAKPAINRAAAT